MKSIPLAMIWSLLARGRWTLLAGFLTAQLIPMILLTALRLDQALDPEDVSSIIIHFASAMINGVTFGAAIHASLERPSRFYSYPVSSERIVAWLMIPAAVFLFLEAVASTLLVNAIYGLNWPIWGPALFVAIGLIATQGVLWFAEKSAWLVPLLVIVGGGMGFWLTCRYGMPLHQASHYWRTITPGEMGALIGFATLAYVMGAVGVRLDRCGESVQTEFLKKLYERIDNALLRTQTPFANYRDAQFWYEWQQKGVMHWLVAAIFIICFLGWLLFNRQPMNLRHGAFVLGYFMPLFGMIVGLAIGSSGGGEGKLEMGQFLATRPVTNRDLAYSIVKTTSLNVMGAWLVWCVVAGGTTLFFYIAGMPLETIPPPEFNWWYFPGVLLATWLAAGLATSLVICGRQRLIVIAISTVIGLTILAMLFGRWALNPEQQAFFRNAANSLISAAYISATIWGFRAARQRVLISHRTTVLAFTAVAVVAALAIAQSHHQFKTALATEFLLLGITSLLAAPLAFIPLAVSWNRHR